jgi:hypothetical protein
MNILLIPHGQGGQPNVPPKKVPTTRLTKFSLGLISVAYLALAGTSIYFLLHEGHTWSGDATTLTWILAIIGVVFSVLSRSLSAQCEAAGLQSLGSEATTSSTSLLDLHKMDIGVRGPIASFLTEAAWPWGWIYKIIIPSIAILTSFAIKKSFGLGVAHQLVIISGSEATTIDPVAVGTGSRGTSFAGAIVYNITTSMGTQMNPAQTSWTYLVTNASDATGSTPVTYYMPSLPKFVAAGSTGYDNYSATAIPALVAEVRCSNRSFTISDPEGYIYNANNNISLTYTSDGVAVMQVMTAANTVWSCLSTVSATNGDFKFTSDNHGNWYISGTSGLEPTSQITFSTTPARWLMMADIISDALGTTAVYAGWDWDSSSPKSVGYSMMLLSSRLSFAAATLGFSEKRAPAGAKLTSGQAYQPHQEVKLLHNWALYLTMILLFIQGLIPLFYIWKLGKFQVDFGILQIMEMRAAAVDPPHQDHGVQLSGHCSKYRLDLLGNIGNTRLRIRSRNNQQHLALLRDTAGAIAQPWAQDIQGRRRYI